MQSAGNVFAGIQMEGAVKEVSTGSSIGSMGTWG